MRALEAFMVFVDGVDNVTDGTSGALGELEEEEEVEEVAGSVMAEIGMDVELGSSSWSSVLMSLFRSRSLSYIVLRPSLTSVSLISTSPCDLMIRITCSLIANVSPRWTAVWVPSDRSSF